MIRSQVLAFHPMAVQLGDGLGHGGHGDRRGHPVAGHRNTEHVACVIVGTGDRRRLALLLARQRCGVLADEAVFGLSVSQNIKSWSLVETVLSVTGIAVVLALSVVV